MQDAIPTPTPTATPTIDGPAPDTNGDGAAPAKGKGKAPASASKGKARPKLPKAAPPRPVPAPKTTPKKGGSGGKVPGKATKAPATKAPTEATATEATVETVAVSPARPPRRGRGPTDPRRFQDAANLLKHMADPTRLQVILALGTDGETHVGGLCAQFGQSQPAVSHHLALLRHGGIIQPRRQGKNNFYGLTDKGRLLLRTIQVLMDGD